jgi:hypothetical protein
MGSLELAAEELERWRDGPFDVQAPISISPAMAARAPGRHGARSGDEAYVTARVE